MRIPDHPTAIRRMLDSRLKKLAPRSPVLAASLNAYPTVVAGPSAAVTTVALCTPAST
jgi:hypothetical protein